MENLRTVFTVLIDNALRVIGAGALIVVAGFLLWWWF